MTNWKGGNKKIRTILVAVLALLSPLSAKAAQVDATQSVAATFDISSFLPLPNLLVSTISWECGVDCFAGGLPNGAGTLTGSYTATVTNNFGGVLYNQTIGPVADALGGSPNPNVPIPAGSNTLTVIFGHVDDTFDVSLIGLELASDGRAYSLFSSSVVAIPLNAVPLPAAGLLMLSAVAGTVMVSRRKPKGRVKA